jgi:hypothetical protein
MPILSSAGNLLTPVSGFTQTFLNVATFSYTGANQTFVVPYGVRTIKARCWGAGGGSGASNGSPTGGGAGGYSYADIAVIAGQTLLIVAGQGGVAHSTGPSTATVYGHATTPTGRPGGAGASCGMGGGLSGIFLNNTFTQGNALLVSGAGGGGTSYFQNASTNQRGGGGGGANLAGGDGDSQPDGYTAYGRGATTSAGGQNGAVFFKSSNGLGLNNNGINGGALYGGHASDFSSWTEGGGGGSGYWGGGPGNHDSAGGNWGNGGGGSGYANLTYCTNVVGASATKNVISSTATADPYYASGIGTGNAAAAGGNGRVVLVY